MSRLQIAKQLVDIAFEAIQLKAQMSRERRRREVSAQLYIQQFEETKEELVKALAPVFEEMVQDMAERLRLLGGEKRRDGTWVGPESTPNYEALRQRIRDGKAQCSVCGSKRELRVHHLDGNSRNDRRSNLRVICEGCHQSDHRGKDAKDWRQQPRVPAGNPAGGQWGNIGGSWSQGAGWTGGGTEAEGGVGAERGKLLSGEGFRKMDRYAERQDWMKDNSVGYPDRMSVRPRGHPLERGQLEAVKHYRDCGAPGSKKAQQWVNTQLRQGEVKGKTKHQLEELDNLFENEDYRVKENITVYRGYSKHRFEEMAKSAPGTIFSDKAFTSTTLSLSDAKAFAGMGNKGSIVEIRVSKGQKAIPLSNGIPPGGAAEVLLNRGGALRVEGKYEGRLILTYMGDANDLP